MKPPYYAVIFTNTLSANTEGYSEMASEMETLAKSQPGYLGIDHARNEIGITISYWKTLEDIANWKAQLEHQKAQHLGKSKWYKNYTVRICKVERAYDYNIK